VSQTRRLRSGLLSEVVAAIFDGLIIHDGRVITDANDRAAAIFGFENAEALIGLPYQALLAGRGKRGTQMRVDSRTEGPYTALCRAQDGTEFPVEVNTRELVWDDARARLVVFRSRGSDHDATADLAAHRALTLDQTVKALASTIEQRDVFTAGHQMRVSALATSVGERLGMSERELVTIRIAGNIHDIGKISVPTEILMKPASLTRQECELVKLHPDTGAAIVANVEFDGPVRETILQHHERLDGSGYPAGINDPVPEARVIAVADVYDAITTSRPYRAGMSAVRAMEIMHEQAGSLDEQALTELESVVIG